MLIRYLGSDHSMQVTVNEFHYSRAVRCSNKGPPYGSCATIFNTMNALNVDQIFGTTGQPRVEVPLPMEIKIRKLSAPGVLGCD